MDEGTAGRGPPHALEPPVDEHDEGEDGYRGVERGDSSQKDVGDA